MQGVMSLIIVMLLVVGSVVTITVVSNHALAASHLLFKNKAECIDYVIHGTNIARNHALESVKVSKQIADKICAEY